MSDKAQPARDKRHDHRQSLWIIAGGGVLWCYRCGAWRLNRKEGEWHRPTGPEGRNPALARTEAPVTPRKPAKEKL